MISRRLGVVTSFVISDYKIASEEIPLPSAYFLTPKGLEDRSKFVCGHMLAGAGFNDILDLGVGQPLAFGVVAPIGDGKQFQQEFFLHGGLDIQLGPIVEDCDLGS